MRVSVCFACGAILIACAITLSSALSVRPEFKDQVSSPVVCATDYLWQHHIDAYNLTKGRDHYTRAGPFATCATQGDCDKPDYRKKAPSGDMTINLVFHVMSAANGTAPNGVTQATINAALAQLQNDYNEYNVLFNLVSTQFHKDNSYYCIGAYGGSSDAWLDQIDSMKTEYAVSPSSNLNIFVSCQTQGPQGTLLGIGTFPWDPIALTALGGIWVNSLAIGAGLRTLTHEMGHNLGLWHTFHGVSEVTSCMAGCYERYHSVSDTAADKVGDFCSDTPGTPTNFECSAPGGKDCFGVSWGQTDYSNFMSYSDDGCMDHFSDQQVARMHCWACSELENQMPEACAAERSDVVESLVETA